MEPGNLLTTRFESPALEEAFREQYQRVHWVQNTVAAVSGIFLYALFGLVDRMVLPEGWETLWRVRFEVTFPLMLLVFTIQFFKPLGMRWSGPLIFVAMLITGVSIVVMNLHMPQESQNLYFYGLFLVIIFGHVFWRAYFLWPSAASVILFVVYLVITLRFTDLPVAHLVTAAFYYVSALVILIYAGWFFERQERRSFLLQHELHEAATTDALTGIANRRAFFERLDYEWRRATREGEPLCLLLVDLDNMKEINDSGGHDQGDAALTRVARVLQRHGRRAGDLAARLGGDEFVLMLSGSDAEAACKLGLRVVNELSRGALPVSVSVGVACMEPSALEGAESLLKRADQALYKAKALGRSQAVCWDPDSGGRQISA